MGKVIARRIHGMSWTAKVSLVLICTVLTSIFMYEGWYKPRNTQAAVATLNTWAHLAATAPAVSSGTYSAGSITATAGTNRVLLVAVAIETGTATTMSTLSASVGGTTLTLLKSTAATSARSHAYVGYLLNSQIPTAASAVSVSYNTGNTANTVTGLDVKWAVYSGVDQTTPFTSSNALYSAATTVTFGATISYNVGGMAFFIAENGGTPATVTNPTGFTSVTAATNTSTSGHSTFVSQSAVATAAGSYASTSTVTFGGTTSSRSAIVVASLNPAATTAAPTITSVSPATAGQGASSRTITITGTNLTGASVSFSNAGITQAAAPTVTATQITVPINVSSSATTGAGTVTVATTGGNASSTFTVTAAPTVTAVSPNTAAQGATTSVTITGTNFATGATISFGTGITVNSTTYVSATSYTANITVGASATAGSYNITVTNTDGGVGTGTGLFTVTAPVVNNTTVGAMSFPTVGATSIQVQVAYTGDSNNNNTCTIKWGTTSGTYPNTATATKGSGVYTATVSGLTASTTYYFQATFTDADGVTPTTGIVTGSQATTSVAAAWANNPSLHNSTNLSSTKWSTRGWGIPNGKYGGFTCSTCHSKGSTNIKRIKTSIQSPSLENWSSVGNSNTVSVVYLNHSTQLGSDTAHTTSTNVCEVCHKRTSHHTYNNPGANHNGTVDCTQCHNHNNGFAASGGDCLGCHSKTVASTVYPGITRRAVTPEFGKNWSHTRTGGAVTKYDCCVCHMEGDPLTGNTVSPYHAAGKGNGVVELRDPDTGSMITNFSGAAYSFKRFSTTFATKATVVRTNATDYIVANNFCLKCHDANGQNSGANYRVAGGTNLKPFGQATSVRNVLGWFSSAGARGSYHPVRRLQTQAYAMGKMAAPWTSTHKIMTCWDCHNTASGGLATTRTVDAHGTGSVATLMRNGTKFWTTGAVSSTNATTFCQQCHTGYASGQNHGTGSAFTSSTDSGMSNYVGYACYYCHSSGPSSLTTQSRMMRSQDVHGFNKLPSGSNWSDGSVPYGFIRSTGFTNAGYRNKVLSGPGVVTGSATCTGFNGTNGTTSCSRSSMGTYTPGGAY